MEKNLYIDASHPDETRVVLKENGNKVIHKSFDGLGHIGLLLSIAGSDLFEIDVRNEIIKSLAELSKY